MITDWVIGIFYSLFQMFVGGLSDMPEKPWTMKQMYDVWSFFGNANFWFPFEEVIWSFRIIGPIFLGFIVFRIIRLFTPGG